MVISLGQEEEEKTEDGEYVNARSVALEGLAIKIASGNYKVMREEVIHHMANINR